MAWRQVPELYNANGVYVAFFMSTARRASLVLALLMRAQNGCRVTGLNLTGTHKSGHQIDNQISTWGLAGMS